MSISNLTYSLPDVANHFQVEPLDVMRWAALGAIKTEDVGGKPCVLHDELVAAIPKLANVAMGIKRKGDWFDMVFVPKAKSRYAAAVKGAAMEQMLTPGEVEARVNGRTRSMSMELLYSVEISQAVQEPFLGGFRKKVKESIGKNSDYWTPPNILTAYIADHLISSVKRSAAGSMAKLYESKPMFETHVNEAVAEFMANESQFSEVMQSSVMNVAVVYSLLHRTAFRDEQVRRVASWIF